MAADRKTRKMPFARSVFRDALEGPGCAVCLALARVEKESLYSFLYEGMTTPAVLDRFLAGGGFCPRHFWWVMNAPANRWGVGRVELASLCRILVSRAAAALAAAAPPPVRAGLFSRRAVRKRLPAACGAACIFCAERDQREASFIALLEQALAYDDLQRAVAAEGLCACHAAQALAAWKGDDRVAWLRANVGQHTARLATDLAEFLRKYDYRFLDLPFGAEADAVDRAVRFLAGLDSSRARAERPRSAPAAGKHRGALR